MVSEPLFWMYADADGDVDSESPEAGVQAAIRSSRVTSTMIRAAILIQSNYNRKKFQAEAKPEIAARAVELETERDPLIIRKR